MPRRRFRPLSSFVLLALASCHKPPTALPPPNRDAAPEAARVLLDASVRTRASAPRADASAADALELPPAPTALEAVRQLRVSIYGQADTSVPFATVDADGDGTADALFDGASAEACVLALHRANGWTAYTLDTVTADREEHCLQPIRSDGRMYLPVWGSGHEVVSAPGAPPYSDTWREIAVYAVLGGDVVQVFTTQIRNRDLDAIGDVAMSALADGSIVVSGNAGDAGSQGPHLVLRWNPGARRLEPATCWEETTRPTAAPVVHPCSVTPRASFHLRTIETIERTTDNTELGPGVRLDVLHATRMWRGAATLYCVRVPGTATDPPVTGYAFVLPNEFVPPGCGGL